MLSMMGTQNKANATQHAKHVEAGIDYAEANQNQQQLMHALDASHQNEEQQLGSVRASYGASGVTMSGTAASVMNSQAGTMESKIAAMSSAETLKTNVLITQGNEAMREADDAETQGFLQQGAQAFGGFMKGVAAGA